MTRALVAAEKNIKNAADDSRNTFTALIIGNLIDMKIGVISDTHGMLKPGVIKVLETADSILHAGDVGGADVLEVLQRLAPTHCVRGNMDGGSWSKALPTSDMVEFGGKLFYLVHDLYTMDIDPAAAGVEVIISGHTHQSDIRRDGGILYLNPGSASYGRHGSPPSLAWIEISNGHLYPRIVSLNS
jgi:putative phosphoesterase